MRYNRTYHFDFNLLDLKPQDNGPEQTENESRIAIDYVLGSDTLQPYLYYDTKA